MAIRKNTKTNRKQIKEKPNNDLQNELKGVIFVVLSIFFFLIILNFELGIIGEYFLLGIKFLFGKLEILVPILLFYYGCKLCVFHERSSFNKLLLSLILLLFSILGLVHNYISPLGLELDRTVIYNGGGVIGGMIVYVLRNSINVVGTWIVLSGLFIIAGILSGKFSIQKSVSTASNGMKKVALAANKKIQEQRKVKRQFFDQDFFNNSSQNNENNVSKSKFLFDDKVILEAKTIENNKEKAVNANKVEPLDTTGLLSEQIGSIDKKEDAHNVEFENDEITKSGFNQEKDSTNGHFDNFNYGKTDLCDSKSTELLNDNLMQVKNEEKVVNKFITEKDENDKEEINNGYIYPPSNLLDSVIFKKNESDNKEVEKQCEILLKTLSDFSVKVRLLNIVKGPSITRFELDPAPGVKVSKIIRLADDLALKLAVQGIRIEAVPGKAAIGVEVPNLNKTPVQFKSVIESNEFKNSNSKLTVGLGKNISGKVCLANLGNMPHLLIAGATGSGKSVCINTIIASILFNATPDEVKLILVDPKVVELSNYNGIPHLLTPVVIGAKEAASALHWAVIEMEKRYKLFADLKVRDINKYNKIAENKLPFIVIIIDELSDLMMVAAVDVEDAILRLAQKARAAGIHLILATQRPSVDVITGIVKANIPSRLAFAVSSQTDSRTILDMGGAEKLLGKGDMLFYPSGTSKPIRIQGAFVSDEELERVIDFIKSLALPVEFDAEVTTQELRVDEKKNLENLNSDDYEDVYLNDAIKLVADLGQASTTLLQRKFRIGYSRAARIMDSLEEMGVVGPPCGSKPRKVLMNRDEIKKRSLSEDISSEG